MQKQIIDIVCSQLAERRFQAPPHVVHAKAPSYHQALGLLPCNAPESGHQRRSSASHTPRHTQQRRAARRRNAALGGDGEAAALPRDKIAQYALGIAVAVRPSYVEMRHASLCRYAKQL